MSDKEADNDAPASTTEPEPTPETQVSAAEAPSSTSDEVAEEQPAKIATAAEEESAPEKPQISSTDEQNVEKQLEDEPKPDDQSKPEEESEVQSKPEVEEPQDPPIEEPPQDAPIKDPPIEEPSQPVSESAPSPAPVEEAVSKTERRESNAEEPPKPVEQESIENQEPASAPPQEPVVERKQSDVNEKDTTDAVAVESASENDTNDEIQNMIKELTDPADTAPPAPHDTEKPQTGRETTENLLSVLEDEIEKPSTSEPPPVVTSTVAPPKEPASAPVATTSTEGIVKPTKPKKYLYKLKSKTGKILHYTSTVPITLKRPVIHLTKMEDTSKPANPLRKLIDSDKDDVHSDNFTKENNVKENEAPNDNVMRTTIRKKGRPPLASKIPPVITLDGNSSDTTEDFRNKSTPSFSMQTRKRQLKFLPDGRLIAPEKRIKSDDQKGESSDSDVDIISSDGEQLAAKKLEPLTKKFQPPPKVNNSFGERRKYKKVFDFESYYREKTGVTPPANLVRAQGGKTFTSLTPIRKIIDTPRPKSIAPSSSLAPKKASSVDPAQLLSSLIGVPITASQLNVVKFKPKIIQERTNNVVASTPKKVTFEDEKQKFTSANQSELLKSTPFKIVSKPTYQKILPKPTIMEKTPNRMAFQPMSIDNKYSTPSSVMVPATPPYLRESLSDTLSKFDAFSDSKVVKTKEGPKKAVKRKYTADDGMLKDSSYKTIYDLMYEIFDKMPSWNLHVIPDTNYFCLAQVSRGRMGIPTLKKSIELNSEFFAKVYVHQLHCKRYDGIYDTESKIIKLIKEIDALAA